MTSPPPRSPPQHHCPTYWCLALSPPHPKEFCFVAPSTGYLTSHLTLTPVHLTHLPLDSDPCKHCDDTGLLLVSTFSLLSSQQEH